MSIRNTIRDDRRGGSPGGMLRAAVLPVLTLLASCINDPEPVQPLCEGGYEVHLSLSAGYLSTRAAEHPRDLGTEAESFIDIDAKDFAVYIFNGETGAYVERFEPAAVTLQKAATSTEAPYRYDIRGAFLPPAGLEQVQFMVLANWQGAFGGSYYRAEQAMKQLTLSQVYGAAGNESLNFALSGAATTTGWQPNDNGSGGIPMFGVSEAIAIDVNTEQTLEPQVIPMLRALAKIEVVDKTPEGNLNIEKCELTGYNRNGRFIPAVEITPTGYTTWSAWANAVPGISLPEVPAKVETRIPFAKLPDKPIVIEGETVARTRYALYLPEMTLPGGEANPVVQITINGTEYTVELAAHENGKPKTPYTELLRNHNYCFNILSMGVNVDLTLYIETPDWVLADDEYYYEDTAAKYAEYAENGGVFTWAWSEENKDKDEVVLGGEEEKRRVVVVSKEGGIEGIATFTFEEPARGTWTLSLSPDDGTPNHWFRIDLWDEGTGQWIKTDENTEMASLTGKIAPKNGTPTQVKIRIVAQDLQYEGVPYSARLLMSVTTFDGRMAGVNLTTADPMTPIGEQDHYIIKQYPTSEL